MCVIARSGIFTLPAITEVVYLSSTEQELIVGDPGVKIDTKSLKAEFHI